MGYPRANPDDQLSDTEAPGFYVMRIYRVAILLMFFPFVSQPGRYGRLAFCNVDRMISDWRLSPEDQSVLNEPQPIESFEDWEITRIPK